MGLGKNLTADIGAALFLIGAKCWLWGSLQVFLCSVSLGNAHKLQGLEERIFKQV